MRACIFTDLCAAKAPQQLYIRGVSLPDNTAKARQPAAVYTAANYLRSASCCLHSSQLPIHIYRVSPSVQQRSEAAAYTAAAAAAAHIYMAEGQKAQRQMDVTYMRGASPLASGRGKSST